MTRVTRVTRITKVLTRSTPAPGGTTIVYAGNAEMYRGCHAACSQKRQMFDTMNLIDTACATHHCRPRQPAFVHSDASS